MNKSPVLSTGVQAMASDSAYLFTARAVKVLVNPLNGRIRRLERELATARLRSGRKRR
jgi:hypothetical protein